nr:hypothetical protein [Chromobacterium sp. ASV5]
MNARRGARGLSTLFMVLTLLAIASLALLASSRLLSLEHANAQNQHRYHQALNYAELGLQQAELALAAGKPLPRDPRFALSLAPAKNGWQTLRSAGLYDGERVSVSRDVKRDQGPPAGAALSLVGDLALAGDIRVLTDAAPAAVSVDGNVTLGGSVSGIGSLASSGNVTITGNQTLDSLHANGDVDISDGSYQEIKSAGSLTLRGGARVLRLARVNGAARFFNSPGADGPAIGQAETQGDVEIRMGGARIGRLDSRGSVRIDGIGRLEQLRALGNVSIQGWGSPVSGVFAGEARYNAANPEIRLSREPALSLPLQAVPRVALARPRLDAYDYRGEAHYQFDFTPQGRIRVHVRAVGALADGDYQLGKDPERNLPNHLCRQLNAQGQCLPGQPAILFCKGHTAHNDCFAGSRPGHWQLDGQTLAPGVAWFDGDLRLGNGVYHNSFIASGHIVTSGQHISYAVNYAAAVGVCLNPDFPKLRPRDDCDAEGRYRGRPVGNAVLMAGGYRDGRFQGGDITLGAFSQVYGNVWAGNLLNCGGSTTIHGYVAAARQAGAAQPGHRWGGSTTIDLRALPPSFTPGDGGGATPAGQTLRLRAFSWIDGGSP